MQYQQSRLSTKAEPMRARRERLLAPTTKTVEMEMEAETATTATDDAEFVKLGGSFCPFVLKPTSATTQPFFLVATNIFLSLHIVSHP